MQSSSARQAEIRSLADDHAALAREFQALHEQARALECLEMSRAERRAQIDALVQAEGDVLDQAHHIRQRLHRLVREQHRQQ